MADKKTSIGCLFWIALILLVTVIVLANLKTADKIIKQTGFEKIIADFFEKKEDSSGPGPETEPVRENEEQEPVATERPVQDRETEDEIIDEEEPEMTALPQPTGIPARNEEDRKKNLRRAVIYFVKVDKEGNILLKGFDRAVYFDDSPLKDTLLTLLQGPVSNEINMEFYSMIPENTRLNNIYVKGSVAFIDFNENFRFNPLGVEGLKAQLNQVVYTATEFANVQKVQILIDGNMVNYLGPEGIYIGEPLSRSSLVASK